MQGVANMGAINGHLQPGRTRGWRVDGRRGRALVRTSEDGCDEEKSSDGEEHAKERKNKVFFFVTSGIVSILSKLYQT